MDKSLTIWQTLGLAEIKAEKKAGLSTQPAYQDPPHDDEFKAYIPNFLYKPPFGYPLNKNVLHLKALAKNPFIYSVIRTLKDEAATTKWEIRYKKEFVHKSFDKSDKNSENQKDASIKADAIDVEVSESGEDRIKRISNWFYNPNGNEESFNDIISQWIVDLCECDAAVGVKVFNKKGEFSQLFARDGGSFLKNPDIYGYIGNRDDIVVAYKTMNPNLTMPNQIKIYAAAYNETAAYYQYGWTGNSLPVPFGKREIMYIMANPRADSIYGRSPMEVIEDVLLTLVYGTQYNTDFYINGNAPDGLINLMGAEQELCEAFQARMKDKFKSADTALGNERRVGHQYPVYGGAGAAFVPFQLSAKDMEIIEQQKWFTKLVWSAFGVTPDEMGYTENSNKAVSQTQTSVHKRKALKPLLKKIEYIINSQLMTELDPSGELEFAFEDYDIDEELKKATLYQAQINGGWKTAEMVAEEEGIDMEKLKSYKEESAQKEIDKLKQTNPGFLPESKEPETKGFFAGHDGHWVTMRGKHVFITKSGKMIGHDGKEFKINKDDKHATQEELDEKYEEAHRHQEKKKTPDDIQDEAYDDEPVKKEHKFVPDKDLRDLYRMNDKEIARYKDAVRSGESHRSALYDYRDKSTLTTQKPISTSINKMDDPKYVKERQIHESTIKLEKIAKKHGKEGLPWSRAEDAMHSELDMVDLPEETKRRLVRESYGAYHDSDIHAQKNIKLKADYKKDYVQFTYDELIKEHEKLVEVLKNDNPEEIQKEYEEQARELEEYIKNSKQTLKEGDTVKIMSASQLIGKVGRIGKVYNNGSEDFYEVIVGDGRDVLFSDNLKLLRDAQYSLSAQLITQEDKPAEIKSESPDQITNYFNKVRKHLLDQIDKEHSWNQN